MTMATDGNNACALRPPEAARSGYNSDVDARHFWTQLQIESVQ